MGEACVAFLMGSDPDDPVMQSAVAVPGEPGVKIEAR